MAITTQIILINLYSFDTQSTNFPQTSPSFFFFLVFFSPNFSKFNDLYIFWANTVLWECLFKIHNSKWICNYRVFDNGKNRISSKCQQCENGTMTKKRFEWKAMGKLWRREEEQAITEENVETGCWSAKDDWEKTVQTCWLALSLLGVTDQ